MQRIWLFFLLLATLGLSALGNPYSVHTLPLITIQTAINAASAGDTIAVAQELTTKQSLSIKTTPF